MARKIWTWWHPSSNVKVEQYIDDDGKPFYKTIPVSFDGWTRTAVSKRNPSFVEIGQQIIHDQHTQDAAVSSGCFADSHCCSALQCYLDGSMCNMRDELGIRHCKRCKNYKRIKGIAETNEATPIAMEYQNCEIDLNSEIYMMQRNENLKAAGLIKDDSVWRLVWNFFFGWLKRKK